MPRFLNTSVPVAESCRKHNVSPATLQDWKDKFMEGRKQALKIQQEFI